MKEEVFVVLWATKSEDGIVDNGAVLCHEKETAISELTKLYKQSKECVKNVAIDNFDPYEYYFVSSSQEVQWERAIIIKKTFED